VLYEQNVNFIIQR